MRTVNQMRQKKADEAKDYLQKKINKDKKVLEVIEGMIDKDWKKGYIFITGWEPGVSTSESILRKLRVAGYGVEYYKAAHSGDVESYQITWNIEKPEPKPVDPSTIPYDEPVCCFTHDDSGYR